MKKIFNVFINRINILILLLLIVFGFVFRIYGLNNNYSFWTDEASTSRFARGFLQTGVSQIPLTGLKEGTYFSTVYLTALSFKLFGQNEFSARLPEVLFGIVLIIVVYWLTKLLFNELTGIGASFFTTFSYFLISWSRQARGYMILVVFLLFALGYIYKFSLDRKIKNLIISILFLLLSCTTHTLGFNLIPIFIIFLILTGSFKDIFKNKYLLLSVVLTIFLVIYFTNIGQILLILLKNGAIKILKKEIFFSYFHSLFWRQYSLFTFLSFVSLISMFLDKSRKNIIQLYLLLSIITVYLFSSVFLLSVPFEKYVIVLFPILYIMSSHALLTLSKSIFKDKTKIIYIFFILFIVINGNKFSLKPKKYYSMNFDMREIPEIDYKKYYGIVKEKSIIAGIENIAVIEIDEDIPAWYLGEGINGFVPRNDVSEINEKSMMTGYRYLHSLEEFKKIYKEYKYGFVFLIEHNFRFYPEGLVDYARKNLKLEGKESVASFSPDWNYWPVELYSWGF